MSAKPHPTAAVGELLQPIREVEIAVQQAEAYLAALECRSTTTTGSEIQMAGRKVHLTCLHPTSYYLMPVPGRQALLAAVIAEQRDHLIGLRSKLEGLRHKLVQAAKAC